MMETSYAGKLKPIDHVILLGLIRGESPKEIACRTKLSKQAIGARLARAKRLVGVKTTYQLVALEVVNFLEFDSKLPDDATV